MVKLAGIGTGGNSNLDFLRRTAGTALDTSARISEVLSDYLPAKPYPDSGLARRLKSVAQLITADLGARIKENGSLGTDHGAAGPMFLVGQGAKGGVHGKDPSLRDLDQGDLKHHTDFRSVYTTLLEDWLGWEAQAAVGGKFTKLKLLG
jgi:uncharacterized protein (DUF1501 family)